MGDHGQKINRPEDVENSVMAAIIYQPSEVQLGAKKKGKAKAKKTAIQVPTETVIKIPTGVENKKTQTGVKKTQKQTKAEGTAKAMPGNNDAAARAVQATGNLHQQQDADEAKKKKKKGTKKTKAKPTGHTGAKKKATAKAIVIETLADITHL